MVFFGQKLKSLRLNSKMTQEQLAKRLGLTKSVISAYETELRQPSYEVLVQIAKIFNVSTDYLLGLEQKNLYDLSGLTDNEKKAIINLIDAMRNK